MKFNMIIAFTLIISACIPSIPTSPTPMQTNTSVLSVAPLPTATVHATSTPLSMIEVDGLRIPDPKATNPEFFDGHDPDSILVKFANAFGVEIKDIGNLKSVSKTGHDGKQFVALTTGDLAATATFDESGTPLLIAEQDEHGDWIWIEATPAKLYTLNNQVLEITMATYRFDDKGDLDSSNDEWLPMLANDAFKKLILESGNRIFIAGEMDTKWIFSNFKKSDWDRVLSDWDNIKANLDRKELPGGFDYNWQASENLINFALANGMQIRVQHLAYDSDVPEAFWSYSAEEAKKLLEFIVKAKVIKFGSQVNAWDLPDEVIERETYNQGFWTGKKLNAQTTVVLAAKFAREVNPNARLIFVGDFLFENFPDSNFHQHYFAFIDSLIQLDVPIDALINENNLWVRSPVDEEKIARVFAEAKKRNLRIEGGEATIAISSVYPTWPNRRAEITVPEADLPFVQAQMFADMVRLYRENGVFSFGFGNLEDENSFQARLGYPDSKTSLSPNLSGERKPAWYAFMASALKNFE